MVNASAGKPTINLELDFETAKTIFFLVSHVVGSSAVSRRKHTDEIYEALHPIFEKEKFGTSTYDALNKYLAKAPHIEFLEEEGI